MAFQSRIITAGIVLAGVLFAATPTHAAPVSFFVDWSGAEFLNNAEAHGILTLDDSVFANSSAAPFLFPGAEVIDFSLTVSGADSGNGQFSLSDFTAFTWDTAGAELDPDLELIGQATTGGYWGSVHNWSSGTGDFNVYAAESSFAPTADMSFTLRTNNDLINGDKLNLVSFRPVPLPGAVWLFGSVLMGLIGVGQRRRSAV